MKPFAPCSVRCASVLAALTFALHSGGAFATDVYKWVDQRGVVNYSGTPPKNVASKKLDPSEGRLTIIPLPRAAAAPSGYGYSLGTALQARELPLEDRLAVERSVREILANQAAVDREARMAAWREQCVRERWVDCDSDDALISRYGVATYGAPVRTIPPRPIPPTRVIEPQRPPERDFRIAPLDQRDRAAPRGVRP